MKIILLKDTKKVGRKFDVKEVADGYAINMLIPQGFALPATSGNIASLEKKKSIDELVKKDFESALKNALGKLKSGSLQISGKVNEKGHLFAGVHKEQIISELKKESGLELESDWISLDKPLKEIGQHIVKLKVGEKEFDLKVEIMGLK